MRGFRGRRGAKAGKGQTQEHQRELSIRSQIRKEKIPRSFSVDKNRETCPERQKR